MFIFQNDRIYCNTDDGRGSTEKMEPQYSPPESLKKPIAVPDRLLCGPGPSNCPPRILNAASLQLVGHLHPECLVIMDDIKAGLQYAFQTTNSMTIAISGTGHAGLEAAMVNVVEPGDRVMVLKNGVWGIRAQDVAERCGTKIAFIASRELTI